MGPFLEDLSIHEQLQANTELQTTVTQKPLFEGKGLNSCSTGFWSMALVKKVFISCLEQAGGRILGFPKGLWRCVSPGYKITPAQGLLGALSPRSFPQPRMLDEIQEENG